MSEVTKARKVVHVYRQEEATAEIEDGATQRSALAPKAFIALLDVLTICERLAKESVSQPITYHDDRHLMARGEDSREISKAIREALES